ncbi:MAG: hypothetical protein IPK26_31960 [Planctomycetes bacterium]|nr:hypothetical protein [Planctomycetota bacterium]
MTAGSPLALQREDHQLAAAPAHELVAAGDARGHGRADALEASGRGAALPHYGKALAAAMTAGARRDPRQRSRRLPAGAAGLRRCGDRA